MKNKKRLSFSICIPVFKGSKVLKKALTSIIKQGFTNYEIIIGDDNPIKLKQEIEKTKKIIKFFKFKKLTYIKNIKNLGYPKNLKNIVSYARNDVLFLLAQDDILSKDAFQKTHDAFFLKNNIGAVTRPYFWFEKDIKKPVRAVFPPNPNKNTILSLKQDKYAISNIFGSIGQLSGLAYKRKCIDIPFNENIFPAHIYPFAGILKKYDCVFLKDFTVAVGISYSQTRLNAAVYNISPTESWVNMFKQVYREKKYEKVRNLCIKHITTHYTGLVQIKNFGNMNLLLREIKILLKYHWTSIFNIKFWFYVIITIFLPKKILLFLSDNYKRHILSKKLKSINFKI